MSRENRLTPGAMSPLMFVGAMVAVQLGGSLAYPIAKTGLEIIEPFTFGFYRFLLASALLLILNHFQKDGQPIERGDMPRIILLGFLIIPLNQTLYLWGQSLTAAGHAAVLFATTPVFVFVLAIIHLGERPGWRRLLGIGMAVAGAVLIIFGGAVKIGTEYLIGDLIILGSVAAWGYYTIVGKNLVRKYGALRITAYALTSGTAMYFPFGLWRAIQFDYSQTTLAAWGAVAYMAIGLSIVVYVLWYWLLKYMEASRIAVYHNIQPVVATAVAYFFLGEPIGLAFVIGASIVIGGVLITEV